MAVLGNVILLLILHGPFLELASGMSSPKGSNIEDCECARTDFCFDDQVSCTEFTCRNITTVVKVRCARAHFKTFHEQVEPLTHLRISDSDLRLFPEDTFEDYPLQVLVLYRCNITEIPHGLIRPVSGTLIELDFKFNEGLGPIRDNEFREYKGLKRLLLWHNGLEEVSSKAFNGLSNLDTLVLSSNRIKRFEGLEGIKRLEHLSFFQNRLNYVHKNAFKNLSKLQSINFGKNELTTLEEGTFDPLRFGRVRVDLNENPLNCTCSLQWLQDWSKKHEVINALCMPEKIPLEKMTTTSCPSPARESIENASRGQAAGCSGTKMHVLFSVLTYVYLKVF